MGPKNFSEPCLRERYEILGGTANRRRDAKQRPRRAQKSPEAAPDTRGRKDQVTPEESHSEVRGRIPNTEERFARSRSTPSLGRTGSNGRRCNKLGWMLSCARYKNTESCRGAALRGHGVGDWRRIWEPANGFTPGASSAFRVAISNANGLCIVASSECNRVNPHPHIPREWQRDFGTRLREKNSQARDLA